MGKISDNMTGDAAPGKAQLPTAMPDLEILDGAAVDGEAVDGEAVDGEAVDGEAVDEEAIDIAEVDGEADSEPDRDAVGEVLSVPLKLALGGKLIPETLYPA